MDDRGKVWGGLSSLPIVDLGFGIWDLGLRIIRASEHPSSDGGMGERPENPESLFGPEGASRE